MYLYPGDINPKLLHVRSMDNRVVDVAADLKGAVVVLAMGVARTAQLGALEAEHVLVRPVLGLMPLAWVLELCCQ
jgi:hypothetical protein